MGWCQLRMQTKDYAEIVEVVLDIDIYIYFFL